MTSMETKKADNCSKKSCCSGDSPKVDTKTVPEVPASKNDCSKKSCCSGSYPKVGTKTVPQVTASNNSDCSKKSCCSGNISKPATESTFVKADDCCSSAKLVELASEASMANADGCSKKSCCTKSASKPVSTVNVSKADDCSKETCCTGKVSVSSCSSAANADIQSASAALDSIKVVASSPNTGSVTGIDNVDIENGLFEVEHLVLSVHGMTCTGCEKKLYRSLDSLPVISNIKTSLVLAQAEFDLTGSTAVDSVNIIKTIEKMTGFTCTKMIQSGEELDMIVGGNVQNFATEEDPPLGVTDLTVLGKNTIRITYHPKIVGARELLSNPFFRLAQLAPPAARPLIASGRAHVRMCFLWRFCLPC
jgi:copper chaperone CopZ